MLLKFIPGTDYRSAEARERYETALAAQRRRAFWHAVEIRAEAWWRLRHAVERGAIVFPSTALLDNPYRRA